MAIQSGKGKKTLLTWHLILFRKVKFVNRAADEKKIINQRPELKEAFDECLTDYVAGSPTDEKVKYTHLSPAQIALKLACKGFGGLSAYLMRQFLKVLGFKKRRMHKSLTKKDVPLRNEQFENIAALKESFLARGLPVLSIDTKSKELLGSFYRGGTYYSQGKIKVSDHDFPSCAIGRIIPHGIYDLGKNRGYLTLGTSRDTSEFVCDNIEYFWKNDLQWIYPDADTILLLCDSGGSNNCRHYIFKQDIYQLARKLQLKIVIVHYPTYCSKWNPIEHRLFSQISRMWKGLVFSDIQIVKQHAELTSTKTGLEVKVRIHEKRYEMGRKTTNLFRENIEKFVRFDDLIPKWNYWVSGI